MRYLELPIIIGGEVYNVNKDYENYILSYKNLEVKIPKLNDELIEKIDLIKGEDIHNLTLNDIVNFLCKVAQLWRNPDYHYRKVLMEVGPTITGQSPQMYTHNVGVMLSLISFKEYLQDMVHSELNNKALLDEWLPCYNAYIHAEPLGNLLHIISGNVPMAGVYSIVRGILTKNVNLAKLSSRDIITLLLFIQSFRDVDPNHPITKSTSAVYWERKDEKLINYFTQKANGICIWGGKETIESYKAKCGLGCEIIEYGPKTGMQIIQWDENSAHDLPLRVARDICMFDQEACLSPQIIYIQGNVDTFIQKLKKGLQDYTQLWPKAENEIDHFVHMNYTIKANAFCGNPSENSETLDWLIINKKERVDISLEHPLGRTIYIYPLENIRDCLQFVDSKIQTVGVEPKSLAYELKDELSKRGVLRIANIGFVDAPRHGLVHESQYLTRLVRICGIEREVTYRYKEYDVPDDYFGQFQFALTWDNNSADGDGGQNDK